MADLDDSLLNPEALCPTSLIRLLDLVAQKHAQLQSCQAGRAGASLSTAASHIERKIVPERNMVRRVG